MTRFVLLIALLALAGCASSAPVPDASGAAVAEAALRGGSPQIALRLASDVLTRDPTNQKALLTQGEALTALGNMDEAATSFRALLALDPTNVRGEIGLARYLLTTDPQSAEALLLQVVLHEPRNATALIDLGVARDLQRRHADAQVAYRDALAADPTQVAAQVNLALSLAMSGQGRQAVAMMRPLVGNPGGSRKMRHNLAAVLVMSGDRAEAERILSADMPPDQVAQAIAAYSEAVVHPAALALAP